MKYKTKRNLKTILLAVLGIGIVVGAGTGIAKLVEEKEEELIKIYPVFEVGGLDSDGKFEESKTTLYTKEAFKCQGLDIKLDFDSTSSYQVFYYDEDMQFTNATDVLTSAYELDVDEDVFYARLEITPLWNEMGEDYKDSKNRVVKWYETTKYSSQIEVKVNKEQKSSEDLFEERSQATNVTSYEYWEFGSYATVDGENQDSSSNRIRTKNYIDVKSFTSIAVNDNCTDMYLFCYDKDFNYLGNTTNDYPEMPSTGVNFKSIVSKNILSWNSDVAYIKLVVAYNSEKSITQTLADYQIVVK